MLINIIIDDSTLNFTISKRLSLCRQSVQVLFFILDCHGPRLFDPLWNSFTVSKSAQRSRSKSSNDEDDMPEECSLQQYEDFFDFVKSVLQHYDTSEEQDKQKQVSFGVFVVLLPWYHANWCRIGVLGGMVCKLLHSTAYYSIF